MSFTLAKFKQTCADCSSFLDTVCGWCIEGLRSAWGCVCTCIVMGFESCATRAAIANCGCPDGTKEAGSVITGVWFGFTAAAELLALAAKHCPDDPHLRYELYGSHTDEAGITTTNIVCPSSVADWDAIPVSGNAYNIDLADSAIVRSSGECVGGAFFLSVDDLSIVTLPLPEGAPAGSVSCRQRGGNFAYSMRISAACNDKTLVICPFPGVMGSETACGVPPDYCEQWNLVDTRQTGCHIEMDFVHVAGECPLTCTVDGEVLTGDSYTIMRDIDPCEEGASKVIDVVRAWSHECAHECSAHDGTDTYTFFA